MAMHYGLQFTVFNKKTRGTIVTVIEVEEETYRDKSLCLELANRYARGLPKGHTVKKFEHVKREVN